MYIYIYIYVYLFIYVYVYVVTPTTSIYLQYLSLLLIFPVSNAYSIKSLADL